MVKDDVSITIAADTAIQMHQHERRLMSEKCRRHDWRHEIILLFPRNVIQGSMGGRDEDEILPSVRSVRAKPYSMGLTDI